MKTNTPLVIAITLLVAACVEAPTIAPAANPDQPQLATHLSTNQAIDKYLGGRELDPVEGAWSHDGSAYEILIVRNDFNIEPEYDYLGIITHAERGTWKQGEVKLLMRETSSASEFAGIWLMENKTRQKMTFVVENKNLIQANFVSSDGETFFIRAHRMRVAR